MLPLFLYLYGVARGWRILSFSCLIHSNNWLCNIKTCNFAHYTSMVIWCHQKCTRLNTFRMQGHFPLSFYVKVIISTGEFRTLSKIQVRAFNGLRSLKRYWKCRYKKCISKFVIAYLVFTVVLQPSELFFVFLYWYIWY